MPRIPFDLAQVPDVNARSIGGQVGDAPVVGNRQLGGALGGMSDALGQGARVADDFAMGQARQTAAGLTAANSFTPKFMALKASSAPGAPGFADQVSQAHDQFVADSTDSIEDPMVRMAVRRNLQAQKASYVGQASEYEYAANEQNQRNVAAIGLGQTYNDLAADPSIPTYQRTLQNGFNLIDNMQGVDGTTKATMKVQHLHQSSLSFAKGALTAVNTPADLTRFNQMIATPGLKDAMAPGAYDTILRTAASMGKAFDRQAGAGLNATVQDMTRRLRLGGTIGDDEIKSVEGNPLLARNPGAMYGLADIKARRNVQQTYAHASISDLIGAHNDAVQQVSRPGDPTVTQNVPPVVADAIRKASAVTGCDPDYLASLAHAEYGSEIWSGDYGKGPAVGGSARGITQMQPGTFLDLVKGNADIFGSVMQPPVNGQQLLARSDDELLALRSDPQLSVVAGGLYANQNKARLASVVGREPTGAEVYTGHFLGPAGAARFLTAVQNTPDAPAGSVVGADVVKANPGVFKDRAGNDLSCQQAFAEIGANFANNPTRVAAVQADQLRQMAQRATQDYRKDPAAYAVQAGAAAPLSNDAATWQKRAADIQSFAAQQGTIGADGKPLPAPRPFTNTEAQYYTGVLANPDLPTDQQVAIFKQIQQFGDPRIIDAAYHQIGVKHPVAALVGRLVSSGSDPDVGVKTLEGVKLLQRNASLGEAMGLSPANVQRAFLDYAGSALAMMPSDIRGQGLESVVMDGAKNHYAYKKHVLQGGGASTSIDKNEFENSIDVLAGGRPGWKAIQSVNGFRTLMPDGINAAQMQHWTGKASIADWTRVSYDGSPPCTLSRYPMPGTEQGLMMQAVTPTQLGSAAYHAVGHGYYAITVGNQFLLSRQRDAQGQLQPYLFKMDADTMHAGSGRGAPQAGHHFIVSAGGDLSDAEDTSASAAPPVSAASEAPDMSAVYPAGQQDAADEAQINADLSTIKADQ